MKRLSDYGDTLRIPELCEVLQISHAQYYALKAHGAFPIDPLPSLGGAIRYSKTAVQGYLGSPDGAASHRTRPRTHAGLGGPARFPTVVGAAGRGL